ncbi:hypothetical protein D3C83_157030 [compost metagenome]
MSVKISSKRLWGMRPSIKCTRWTPSSRALTALCTFGRMPLSMMPLFFNPSTSLTFTVEMSVSGFLKSTNRPGTSLM